MTERQAKIHKRAITAGRNWRMAEWDIIESLQDAEETRLFEEFDLTSVYQYAIQYIGLDESQAYVFVNVARKAKEFSRLNQALKDQSLAVSVAARITATLTPQNEKVLVEFATTHSKREVEREVARINPKAAGKNSVKQLSDEYVEVTITLRRPAFEKMQRSEEVHGLSRAETLERVYEQDLERNDPVRKAKRVLKAKKGDAAKSVEDKVKPIASIEQAPDFCPGRTGDLNAAETHAVNDRDEGQCTWTDSEGRRCPNKRWVQIHHKIPRADGGTNELSNLT